MRLLSQLPVRQLTRQLLNYVKKTDGLISGWRDQNKTTPRPGDVRGETGGRVNGSEAREKIREALNLLEAIPEGSCDPIEDWDDEITAAVGLLTEVLDEMEEE